MNTLRALTLLGFALGSTRGGHAQQHETAVQWEPYVGRAADGSELEGRLGRIRVPESRARGGDGAAIEIAFVVYASSDPEPGPPIVYLAGGPGAPGVELCAEAATQPGLRLLDHHDVIGIDQRGTGASRPNLEEGAEFEYELPLDHAATREEVAGAFAEAVRRCAVHWKEAGVDLSAYQSVESADDVDAVRAALGIESWIPWGASYGSHLGLAYLRRHSAHAARAVLAKVEGPDHTWKYPSTVQRMLEQLHARVAADASWRAVLPDLVGALKALLEQLEREPVRIADARLGEGVEVAIGAHDLRALVSAALASSQGVSNLPAALHMMRQGEWRHTLGFVLGNRRGSVGSAMAIAMDCASGASPARRARIERELADARNLLGDAIAAPFYASACEGCGCAELGAAYRAPLRCDVPVLFVSGALDARTPPENVEEILGGFSKGAHVVVTETGHDPRELESEEYRELVRAFLRGEEVEGRIIELPPIALRPPGAR